MLHSTASALGQLDHSARRANSPHALRATDVVAILANAYRIAFALLGILIAHNHQATRCGFPVAINYGALANNTQAHLVVMWALINVCQVLDSHSTVSMRHRRGKNCDNFGFLHFQVVVVELPQSQDEYN